MNAEGPVASDPPAMATLHFDFSSAAFFASPPEVEVTQTKLSAITCFSGSPIQTLPELGEARDAFGLRQELKYTASVKLPSTQMEDVTWHPESGKHGRDSFSRTATVRVPIHLPTSHRVFLPTFYSCFIARTYVLELSVSISGTRTGLSVPLQIAIEAPQHRTSK